MKTLDRRAPLEARLELDSDPRRLRESLGRVSTALPALEAETAQRVRDLVVEIIARSLRGRVDELICLEISVLPTTVRVEATGAPVSPEKWRQRRRSSRFRAWDIDDLADRWDVDRRGDGHAVWFLIERDTHRVAASL